MVCIYRARYIGADCRDRHLGDTQQAQRQFRQGRQTAQLSDPEKLQALVSIPHASAAAFAASSSSSTFTSSSVPKRRLAQSGIKPSPA